MFQGFFDCGCGFVDGCVCVSEDDYGCGLFGYGFLVGCFFGFVGFVGFVCYEAGFFGGCSCGFVSGIGCGLFG